MFPGWDALSYMDAFRGSQDVGVKAPLPLVILIVMGFPSSTVQIVLCSVLYFFDESICDIACLLPPPKGLLGLHLPLSRERGNAPSPRAPE